MPSDEEPPSATSPGDRLGALTLTAAEFAAHCARAEVLERRHGRPLALLHRSVAGALLVTRIWYPRGRLSDRLWPYHERFRRALDRLGELGVRVPRLRAHGSVTGTNARFVICEWLDGVPLRQRGDALDVRALAGFVARLHAAGVYFRGLHLGNIVACADGELAVTDVHNVRFHNRPLSMRLRERNLAVLCAHTADRVYLTDGRWSELVMAYCRAAGMSLAQAAGLREAVRLRVQRRGARASSRRASQDGLARVGNGNIGSVKTP